MPGVRCSVGSALTLPRTDPIPPDFRRSALRGRLLEMPPSQAVANAGWLAAGGWMSVETGRGDIVEGGFHSWIDATRDVGRARLTLLHRS